MNYSDLERAHLTWQILKGILLVWGFLFAHVVWLEAVDLMKSEDLLFGSWGSRWEGQKTDPKDEHYVSIYQRSLYEHHTKLLPGCSK